MKVTLRDIKEVRKHNSNNWHNIDWWKFHTEAKTLSINQALSIKKPLDTDADVKLEAEKILNSGEYNND